MIALIAGVELVVEVVTEVVRNVASRRRGQQAEASYASYVAHGVTCITLDR